MEIILVDELPDDKGGKYAHYEHRPLERHGWEYCDIKKYINDIQQYWLDDLDAWHAELSKLSLEFTPWWWLLNTSRLYPWYPSILKPFFFAMGIIEYCKLIDDKKIYLVKCPKEVGRYIKELKPAFLIYHKSDATGIAPFSGKDLGDGLINCTKYTIDTLEYLVKIFGIFSKVFIHSFPKNKDPDIEEKAYELFIFSVVFNEMEFITNGDYFFGKMFQDIDSIPKEKILWIFCNGFLRQGKKIRGYLRSVGVKYVILEDFLTLSVFGKIFRCWLGLVGKLRLIGKKLPPLRVDRYTSTIFPGVYFYTSVLNEFPATNFFVYIAMKRLLRKCEANTLIYPYEERGFERGILRACAENNKSIRTIGYHHGVHKESHIFFHNRPSHLINPPRPEMIGVIGPAEKKWFVETAKVDRSKVIVIGSAHHREPVYRGIDHEDRRACLKILVLTGFGYELIMLANYVHHVHDLFEYCDVIIRKKPYAIQAEANTGINRLIGLSKNIKVETGSLMDQLRWCDVAMYCVTSAGIEAMLAGRIAIYVDLCDVILMDPLHNKGDTSKVFRC
ncbi:MAG: hypothetical protein ACFFDT_40065, partial [Candidatus Hodarchaeota archaeon]